MIVGRILVLPYAILSTERQSHTYAAVTMIKHLSAVPAHLTGVQDTDARKAKEILSASRTATLKEGVAHLDRHQIPNSPVTPSERDAGQIVPLPVLRP